MITAIETSEPNTAPRGESNGIPDVRQFSREQQDALLTALVKVRLDEMERPRIIPIKDGETMLGFVMPNETEQPLEVVTGDRGGAFIALLVSQLDRVCELLDQHKIPYTVDEQYISENEGPESTIVYLNRDRDASSVQALLDSINHLWKR